MSLNPDNWTIAETLWTDYLWEQPYCDYTVVGIADRELGASEVRRYLAGFGAHGTETFGADPPVVNHHGDLIRSTLLLTDQAGGTPASEVTSYTAFGELAPGYSPLDSRYQFAGGWGYETGPWGAEGAEAAGDSAGRDVNAGLTLYGSNPDLPPISLLHVGWRWYAPALGRFVQRHPIGPKGGLNVYLYAHAGPASFGDPDGLTGNIFWDIYNWLDAVINGKPGGAAGAAAGAGSAANAKWKLGIGRLVNRASVACAGI